MDIKYSVNKRQIVLGAFPILESKQVAFAESNLAERNLDIFGRWEHVCSGECTEDNNDIITGSQQLSVRSLCCPF